MLNTKIEIVLQVDSQYSRHPCAFTVNVSCFKFLIYENRKYYHGNITLRAMHAWLPRICSSMGDKLAYF